MDFAVAQSWSDLYLPDFNPVRAYHSQNTRSERVLSRPLKVNRVSDKERWGILLR